MLKLKIECVGDNWGFYEIKDVTEEYNDICKNEGKEKADEYFAEGTFDPDNSNGTYSYGYIECLGQSDWCPPQIYQKSFEVVITKI